MKKFLVLGFGVLSLAGCANATRTVPVLVVEDRPISIIDDRHQVVEQNAIDYHEQPRSVVTVDSTYLPPLPPPRPMQPHNDSVLREIKKNNFMDYNPAAPSPKPQQAQRGQPHKCKLNQANCRR